MTSTAPREENAPDWVRRLGLLAGPIAAVLMLSLPPPAGLPDAGWAAAAVAVLMAILWMTEALPLAVTALLPLILFPPLGISSLEATAPSYANPLIFLFLGGFLLATAMQKWQLHRRLALAVLRLGGGTPAALIASLMAATAFLSMWVSNTATAMVMLPIAQSLVASLREQEPEGESAARVSAPLLLAVAYAATIGGMGTLIGTPPNALLAAYMKESHGIQIGFAQWMLIGVPMVLVLLPIAWLVLTRIAFGNLWAMRLPRSAALLAGADGLGPLPPMSRQERIVAGVLVAAALAWLLRPLISSFLPGLALSDAGIAITAAALLFVLPSRWSEGTFLLSWSDAKDIRWDVLILFGGGLALAGGIEGSGLAAWIGKGVGRAHHLPPAVLLLLVMATVVYLGELASNTAIAAIFVPVAAAAAIGLGASPLTLALPVALAASLGFMLPVATPPNAIVFGTGAVTGRQMLRAGAILDVVGILTAAGVASVIRPLVFGA